MWQAEAEDRGLAATIVEHLASNGITHDTVTVASVRAMPHPGEVGRGRPNRDSDATSIGRGNDYLAGRLKRDHPELAAAVERGPDPNRDSVVRWRRVDLQALIETRFAVRLHERTVGKVPRRLGFARLSARPRHSKADEAAQEAFVELARAAAITRTETEVGRDRDRTGDGPA